MGIALVKEQARMPSAALAVPETGTRGFPKFYGATMRILLLRPAAHLHLTFKTLPQRIPPCGQVFGICF